ncbi:MAG: GntR family transcriptional regulator [Pseudomonadota bacterium]
MLEIETDVSDDNAPTASSRSNAHRKIMDALLARRIRPGHLVSQREISEITGATLPAVREALKWLEAENVVRLIPKRGVSIREVTRKEVEDAYDLRILIEMQAIGHYVRSADSGELARLRVETEDLIAANAAKSEPILDHFSRRIALDALLHHCIVKSLENQLISDVHQSIETVMLLARLSLPPQFHADGPAFHEHRNLIQKIADRDETGARDALLSHLQGARERASNSVNP